MAGESKGVLCPTCRSEMVLRMANKGRNRGSQFYGCKGFPLCRGTRPFIELVPSLELENSQLQGMPTVTLSSDTQSTAKAKPLTEKQLKELNRLRDRLLNLSSANRSVRLNRLNAKWSFDLSDLNPFGVEHANEIIAKSLNGKGSISILPKPVSEKQIELYGNLSQKLTNLSRNINELERDKGLHDLYVGFPFLCGKPLGTEAFFQAPIFLIPVSLERSKAKKGASEWIITASKDAEAIFNKTLFYALSKLCNLSLNQALFEEEPPKELYGADSFISWTHKTLSEYGVHCEVDPEANDQTIDSVIQFSVPGSRLQKELKRPMPELPDLFKAAGLFIRQNAVLGHFPQSNSSMQMDYEKFLTLDQNSLESLLCFLSSEENEKLGGIGNTESKLPSSFNGSNGNEGEYESKPLVTVDSRPEKENFFLLPSDSSQDRILISLNEPTNKGVVIWGPPGTGKSQTIVNIIGDCLNRGKTVLLVSQKRAAIDVVYERLFAKGLHGLTALVHDTKTDKKDLFKKIVDEISLQATNSQSRIADPSTELDRIAQNLREVQKAYSDNTFGIRLGKIYQQLGSSAKPTMKIGKSWLSKRIDDIPEIAAQLQTLQRLSKTIDQHQDFNQIRCSFSKIANDKKNVLAASLAQLSKAEYLDCCTILEHYKGRKNSLPEIIPGQEISELLAEYALVTQSKSSHFGLFGRLQRSFRRRRVVRTANRLKCRINKEAESALHTMLKKSSANSYSLGIRQGTIDQVAITQIYDHVECRFYEFKGYDQALESLSPEVIDLVSHLSSLSESNSNDDWGSVFERSVLSLWAQELERKYPIIAQVRSGQVDILRDQYRKLLQQKTEYCVQVLRDKFRSTGPNPQTAAYQRLITADVGKRGMSVRKLNEKHMPHPGFRKLLPVWLVSPETVSDVLPCTQGLFDVVIFDEASQCRVEHGLPATFRGRQVIIAGDEKQLPPSNLGESQIEELELDEEEDTNATEEESLLTLAKKTLRYKSSMLEWHYRSQHEELVSFSNQLFYNGRMKIAPNVAPFEKGNEPAIKWHAVKGYWENRANLVEAQKVFERLRYYLLAENSPTIGIITFNAPQKDLILNLIDKARVDDPEFDEMWQQNSMLPLDEQVFVKNIENVQGDEREVIVFSVAYAPDAPGGRVKLQFGSLNGMGGEKRLNVAITRAIQKVEIVCSINPAVDLEVSNTKYSGPKILKDYLCYAKAVSDGDIDRAISILKENNPNLESRSRNKDIFDSSFEEEVANELRSLGYEVHSQVGQSGYRIDLAIVHPQNQNRYLLGIECDGAMFHSDITVRERDVFRQIFLQNRGWVIHRIWSANWWANRDKELMKMRVMVDSLLAREKAG
ncbi:DUF4011 domain-containing protein [bacterium]|nr:DUF4011 domain-containing protein [bacterium]